MATAAPDPFEDDLQRVLSDPEVIERLDRIQDRRRRGELVTHSHEEVLARLARHGVRRERRSERPASDS